MNKINASQSHPRSQVTIFANGEISNQNLPVAADGFIIAADGGAKHCLKLGIQPHLVIGDFDSLSADEITSLETAGTEFVRYPAEKDETDLELALEYALGWGANEVTLFGLLGGRWDMTFANLLLLTSAQYAGIRFKILAGNSIGYILRGGETLELRGRPGDVVSAIPLKGPASGINYTGLQWPLENGTLPFGTPRGVSNTLIDNEAQISLEDGILLIFLIDTVEVNHTHS